VAVIKDINYDFSLMLRLADGSFAWVVGKSTDEGCEVNYQNGSGEPLDAKEKGLARSQARAALLGFLRKVQGEGEP